MRTAGSTMDAEAGCCLAVLLAAVKGMRLVVGWRGKPGEE